MRLYDKFFVLKKEDISKYLSSKQQLQLQEIGQTILRGRLADGKKEHNYLIVNTDESYARKVLDLIEKGELKKEEHEA